MNRVDIRRLFPIWVVLSLIIPGLALAREPPKIDWSRYLNSDEILGIMNELKKSYPKLAKVQIIGKSYLGKDLHLMAIANPDTGPALAKPVLVKVEPQDAVLLDGKNEIRLGHIPGRATVSEEGLFSETVRSASWVLKKTGQKPSVTISAVSGKGGKDEKNLELN